MAGGHHAVSEILALIGSQWGQVQDGTSIEQIARLIELTTKQAKDQEQQLAQTREANGLLAIKNGKLGRERDQALALLEEALADMGNEHWHDATVARKIEAFLDQKESGDGG